MNRRNNKVRTGVALDEYVVKEIDAFVVESIDLSVNRSEVINALLHGFIKSDKTHVEKKEQLRGYIIKMRKGLFNIFFF